MRNKMCNKRGKAAVQTAFDFGKIKRFYALHPKPKIQVDHLHDTELGEIARDKYAIASEGMFHTPFASPDWLKVAGSATCAELLLVLQPLHCHYRAGRITCTYPVWLLDMALEVLPANTPLKVYLHSKAMPRKRIDELNAVASLKTAASVPEAGGLGDIRDALKAAMNLPQTKHLFRKLTGEKLNKLVGGRSRNSFRKDRKDKDTDKDKDKDKDKD